MATFTDSADAWKRHLNDVFTDCDTEESVTVFSAIPGKEKLNPEWVKYLHDLLSGAFEVFRQSCFEEFEQDQENDKPGTTAASTQTPRSKNSHRSIGLQVKLGSETMFAQTPALFRE